MNTGNADVPPPDAETTHALDHRQLLDRLVEVGLSRPAATSLVLEHGGRRVTDALDAFDLLPIDERREPVAWLAESLSDDREVAERLASRRERERRWRSWESARAQRERADRAFEEQQARSAGWSAVLSAALDDDQLAIAIEKVTTPVAGLDRRSVPIARAQLVAWAVDVHLRYPNSSPAVALADDLEAGPPEPDPAEEALPEPPATSAEDDLSQRIGAVLSRRPDLAHAPAVPEDRASTIALERALDRSLTR